MKKGFKKTTSLENLIWNCRNVLRGTVGGNEKNRDAVMGLVFLKFLGDKFEKRKQETMPNYSNILQLGMTSKEVEKIQGIPKFIDEIDEAHRHFEMWTYPNDLTTSHLYFDNNILIRIEK